MRDVSLPHEDLAPEIHASYQIFTFLCTKTGRTNLATKSEIFIRYKNLATTLLWRLDRPFLKRSSL